ncbi:hypothetical protein RXV86_15390 [Alisedimentitalea sp. MJ-SS2]|uniref:hypothetical protein n=1 Tax=Aliisedimentitalea sp. MJ-SS2 TaxID=3049795 RepID=UPI00290EE6EB|nr:hypothetical protein [Alisedimentitalea sp. MJ-SS2]MDU8928775.1 hypothetical protein [Alisedimentitalea sp. MJ-SS2]
MKNDWILDVLADLKAFAKANGLKALAEQLEDTSLVAAAEIASLGEGTTGGARPEQGEIGKNPGGIGTRL